MLNVQQGQTVRPITLVQGVAVCKSFSFFCCFIVKTRAVYLIAFKMCQIFDYMFRMIIIIIIIIMVVIVVVVIFIIISIFTSSNSGGSSMLFVYVYYVG